MASERTVTVDLGDGMKLAVVAEQKGPVLVADDEIVARLDAITEPIARVGEEMLAAVRKAMPSKATVELGFGLALEQGALISLLGKGRGEASIKVTLEWAPESATSAS
jgi:hypothetical protein